MGPIGPMALRLSIPSSSKSPPMSQPSDSPTPIRREDDEAPLVLPARSSRPRPPAAPPGRMPPPPPRSGGFGRVLLILFLFGSLALNFVLFIALFVSSSGDSGDDAVTVTEKVWSGPSSARNKIAVVRVEGTIFESLPAYGYQLKQIDKAAKDSAVKAVVLRVNSPGGTITGSDGLHKRLLEMKEGKSPRYKSDAKPLIVSMGGVAASGGYYISMPGDYIFAERTTMTGSIGVIGTFPDIHKLANEHGVYMHTIKAGNIKGSGSMFQEMTPEEREPFQEMINEAYGTFVKVVEEGRPQLKGKLTKDIVLKDPSGKPITDVDIYDDKGNKLDKKEKVPYHRQLADGGIFTLAQAKELGLIDEVGYLDAACKMAANKASLSEGEYKVVVYDQVMSLFSLLTSGAEQKNPLDWSRLSSATTPRLWYMMPDAEISGILATMANK